MQPVTGSQTESSRIEARRAFVLERWLSDSSILVEDVGKGTAPLMRCASVDSGNDKLRHEIAIEYLEGRMADDGSAMKDVVSAIDGILKKGIQMYNRAAGNAESPLSEFELERRRLKEAIECLRANRQVPAELILELNKTYAAFLHAESRVSDYDAAIGYAFKGVHMMGAFLEDKTNLLEESSRSPRSPRTPRPSLDDTQGSSQKERPHFQVPPRLTTRSGRQSRSEAARHLFGRRPNNTPQAHMGAFLDKSKSFHEWRHGLSQAQHRS